MSTFYTITTEHNGHPDGPHQIIRERGDRYVTWLLTRTEAVAHVLNVLKGRVAK